MIGRVTARLRRWWDWRPGTTLDFLEAWERSTAWSAWLLLGLACRFAAEAADSALWLVPCGLAGLLSVREFGSLRLIRMLIGAAGQSEQRESRDARANDRGLQ